MADKDTLLEMITVLRETRDEAKLVASLRAKVELLGYWELMLSYPYFCSQSVTGILKVWYTIIRG
jgi:hypothetical protein